MNEKCFIVAYSGDSHQIGIYQHILTERKGGKACLDGNTWLKESDVHDNWKAAQDQALAILQEEHVAAQKQLSFVRFEIARVAQLKGP